MDKQPFHVAVAEKLVEQLRAGAAPWQKPWDAAAGLPFNPITGKRYRGINVVQLISQGREDPRWLTYKQASSLDAQVRRGEKGTAIQYWKFTEEQTVIDAGGRPVLDGRGQPVKETVRLERPRVFMATVFNAAQTDGLPPYHRPELAWDPVERAERILEQSGAVFQHGEHDRAFYRPQTDTIHSPPRHHFQTAGAYYATALHELGHWTGHEKRLNRDLAHPFGSEGYAREELRAEIASMILGAELGIGHDTSQHVAYVNAWIKVLQDDPLEIFRAAADAEKIHDYVLGLHLVLDQTATQVAAPHPDAFLDNDNILRAWHRGQPLPDDWEGVVKHRGAYWVIGQEQGKRTFTLLTSTQYPDAQAEAERIAVLAVDIAAVFDDASINHAEAQPDDLKETMCGRGLSTVGSIAGSDPRRFYQQAEDRLSPLFDLPPGYWGMDKAALARNELAQAFADHAAKLVGTLRQTRETDIMSVTDQPAAQSGPDRAVTWTLGHIERNTLAPALDNANLAQLNRVEHVLGVLLPLEPSNPLWQQHQLPDDRDGWEWKIAQAGELVASRQADAHVAVARLALVTGQAFGQVRDGEAHTFAQEAERALGFRIPIEWNGKVLVEPAGGGWDVVLRLHDQDTVTVTSRQDRTDAELLAERLALIDAHSTLDEHDKAIKFAGVHEQRVRRDPNSSEDDIALVREMRKSAELAATLDDADLQRRIEHAQQDRARQAAAEASRAAERVLIAVPFKQKEEAKVLGAKWDRQRQSWYVPPGVDPAPFAKWMGMVPAEAAAGQERTAASRAQRIYLAVPYPERSAAKAAGAQWDTVAKSWYAPPEADLAALAKWRPENAQTQQGPAMTPREEFAQFLESLGCVISGDHPVMDGKAHRITVQGEKFSKNSGSGFYVGHLDGHPAGFAKNNKTGQEGNWKAKGYALDPAEKAQLAASAAAKLQQRETELAQQQERAAARVATQMAKLVPAELPTPYMAAKGLLPAPGVLTDRSGKKTYVPAIDVDGKLWTMQYIQEDGTKRFAKESRKEGCFHIVGGTLDDLAQAPAIVAGEGYATAATLRQSLGFPTVAAFDSGNLVAVVLALHAKFPDKPIVVAGDDDRHLELTQGVNPGRSKAEEAAGMVGGTALLPIFAPGENSYPAELDPVTPKLFREHGRRGAVLSEQQLAALAAMKQFTDFNDLANRSALGEEGVHRQVRAAVERVLSRHGIPLEHGNEQEAVLTAEATPAPEVPRPSKPKRQRKAASVA